MQLGMEVREREQMEEALRERETHLRTLIRTIPDLVWLKDQKGIYLFCNSRFESFFGAKKKDIIGRLAGGVAHDLNNLLSPILGYGEMLLDDFGPNDSRRKKVDQIVQAGLQARDLVRQLLAFSRKQPLEYKPVDMNQAITRFEKLMRRTIREDIEIKLILSPDIQIVMADIGQVEQVIMNLAVNAADAMPEGGRLTIETGRGFIKQQDLGAIDQGPHQINALLFSTAEGGWKCIP